MSQKNMVLVPFFACSLLLVMGALNHQPQPLAPAAGASFVAQPVSLDAGLANSSPDQLLAQAAANLAPEKSPWLRVKTWQKHADGDLIFEAEGNLVRGPNQCARLEMTVHAGKESTTLVTVSDGVGLAHACRSPTRTAQVTSQRFTTPTNAPMTSAQIDLVLNSYGCGGPYFLLKDLEGVLENLRAEAGTWHGTPVIRLSGSTKDNHNSSDQGSKAAPRICHLYLDAQTLWPHRVEWWANAAAPHPHFLFLQLEFRDPEINHPLSHEDCIREFTYVPE